FCKKIDIQQANCEANINNEGRNDSLPPYCTHAVKIIVIGQLLTIDNRQLAISNRQYSFDKRWMGFAFAKSNVLLSFEIQRSAQSGCCKFDFTKQMCRKIKYEWLLFLFYWPLADSCSSP